MEVLELQGRLVQLVQLGSKVSRVTQGFKVSLEQQDQWDFQGQLDSLDRWGLLGSLDTLAQVDKADRPVPLEQLDSLVK